MPSEQEALHNTGGLQLHPAPQGMKISRGFYYCPSTQLLPLDAANVRGQRAATDTVSFPGHGTSQSQKPEGQRQDIPPSVSASVSDSGHRTRSRTNSLGSARTQQRQLASRPPTTAASVHTPAQAPATGSPVKRKPGRPRKHPLPPPPREPSPNPATDLGRTELTQLVTVARQGEEASYEQHGEFSQLGPRPTASSVPTTTGVAPNPPARPSGRLPAYHYSPALPAQLPPVASAPDITQPHVQFSLEITQPHVPLPPVAPAQWPSSAAAPVRRGEDRPVHDLAAVYQAHNPGRLAGRVQYQSAPPNPPLLSIRPGVALYPRNYNPAWNPDALVAIQPQHQPHSSPPFPLNAYWGRDLTGRPVLPTMTIAGGPDMPCFELAEDGNRTDVGFGPGVKIARAFKWVAGEYERRHKKAMLDFDRAMFGMHG